MPVEEDFSHWRETQDSAPPVALERVEDGAAVLLFSRLQGGGAVATVCLSPVEGASFFAEGLDDPPDEVEEWLTEVNTYMSEKPKMSFAEALDALIRKAPGKLGLRLQDDADMEEDEEMDEEADELAYDGFEAMAVEAAADRSAQRAAYSEEQQWSSMVSQSASQGSRQASQVLMREMRALMALQGTGEAKALEIEMVQDSLYHWTVKMHAEGFPADCSLRQELQRFGQQHPSGIAAVVMDVLFPNAYPMEPPFIRVIRPRFAMHTGHITIGGSVCMQLLTPAGWLPSVSLENVFVSIRSEMIEGGGRLDTSLWNRDYTQAEAKEAFARVASRYGWLKP